MDSMGRHGADDQMEPRVTLRWPPLSSFWKAVIVAWFAFTALFIVGGIAGGIPVAAVLVAIILLVGLAWLLKRRPRLGVVGYENELVIRTAFRELKIPRADIVGFRIVTPSVVEGLRTSGRGPLVQLERRDGSVTGLQVTQTTLMNSASPPTDEALRVLSDWLSDGER
jgi:hypothetical protein